VYKVMQRWTAAGQTSSSLQCGG